MKLKVLTVFTFLCGKKISINFKHKFIKKNSIKIF